MTNTNSMTPRNDALFKMIFTDPKHEDVLVNFLNCAIETKDPIKSAKILNSELSKDYVSQKGSRLDIHAETNSGEIVNIELQVARDEHMVGRSLFYWSKLFAGSLVVGDNYGKLRRTISINILSFELFRNHEKYYRKCYLMDRETHEQITDLLEIHFYELDKMRQFTKESPITFWIEFFKNPYSEECKELYKFVPELREAKEVLEAAIADPEKRRLIEAREDAVRNYAAGLSQAKEEGIKEGREEEQAKAHQEKIETAKNFLKMGLSVEQVATGAGLSVEEVAKLD